MTMKMIEHFHASVYGNGASVAEEFKKQMAGREIGVSVHHIDGNDRTQYVLPTFTCSALPVGSASPSRERAGSSRT